MASQVVVEEAWLRTMRKSHPRHFQGRRLYKFVQAVRSRLSFQSFLEAFARSYNDVTRSPKPRLEVGLLHEAARRGCCAILEEFLDESNVNLNADGGVSPLHIAVEYGNYKDVKVLLRSGARVTANDQGLTPLHVAASSAEPNPAIAKLLVDHMTMRQSEQPLSEHQLVNALSGESGDTALHFAAGNRRISRDFIRALKKVDPTVRNNDGETAFHVAASAENPDIIVFMLKVFNPAKAGWEITEIESKEARPLIEICASMGNAEAVELLIMYGADVTKEVFKSIIDESVKRPAMTKSLISVYRTITDNCVLCEWLKARPEERCHYPRPGTEEYKLKQGEIMLRLLNKEIKEGVNVIRYAIKSGAGVFLKEMVNGPVNVFKVNETIDEVKYDITGFLVPPTGGCFCFCNRLKMNAITPAGASNVKKLDKSYIDLIMENKDLSGNTSVLLMEPFKTITRPILMLMRLTYGFLYIIHYLYMFCFSMYYTPDYCSLHDMFNLDLSLLNLNVSVLCNSSTSSMRPLVIHDSKGHVLPFPLWLVWPTIVFIHFILTLYRPISCRCRRRLSCLYVLWYSLKTLKCVREICTPRIPFAIAVWVWYFSVYVSSELYIIMTSLVRLFGCLVLLTYLSVYLDDISALSLLFEEIALHKIYFFVAFSTIFISFASSIHVLRESTLLGKGKFVRTCYDLFASALNTGDFIDETRTSSPYLIDRHVVMRALFAAYLICTAIILLNKLVSMMNDDRDKSARKKALNKWRFQIIRTGIRLIGCCLITLLRGCNYWRIIDELPAAKIFIVEKDHKVFMHCLK